MFWRRRQRETPADRSATSGPLAEDLREEFPTQRPFAETIEVERGAPRAASITRVAEELRRRGEEVAELFKEVTSPAGQTVLPIYLKRGSEDVFVEVETGPWDEKAVDNVLRTAAVLRGSEHSDATFEVLGAYPVPEEIRYFCGRSPAALLQLDLTLHEGLENPEARAQAFKTAAEKHWSMSLNYDPEELRLVEELLLAALGEEAGNGTRAPVLDALVLCLGCYTGEILRRCAPQRGSWRTAPDWDENLVVEFPDVIADPIGNARAFLENGPEDSVAYYVAYALEELDKSSTGPSD